MNEVLRIEADTAFLHVIFAHGSRDLALNSVEQADIDVVVARLNAKGRFHRQGCEMMIECVRRVDADESALVLLAELISVHRIVEKICEVVEQPQRRANCVSVDLR